MHTFKLSSKLSRLGDFLLSPQLGYGLFLLVSLFYGVNAARFLNQPPQHFDWIASFPDLFLIDHKIPRELSDYFELMKGIYTHDNWLFRPASTLMLAWNQSVNSLSTETITAVYFFAVALTGALIWSAVDSKPAKNIGAILGCMLLVHPSQPLLMVYSTEVLLASILALSIVLLSQSLKRKKSRLVSILGSFLCDRFWLQRSRDHRTFCVIGSPTVQFFISARSISQKVFDFWWGDNSCSYGLCGFWGRYGISW